MHDSRARRTARTVLLATSCLYILLMRCTSSSEYLAIGAGALSDCVIPDKEEAGGITGTEQEGRQ